MQKDIYDRIISFLQGASWAIVLGGAFFTFKFSLPFGLSFSIFLTIFFVIVSLFLTLLLDAFCVQKEKLAELQKQTKLLEELHKKLTK